MKTTRKAMPAKVAFLQTWRSSNKRKKKQREQKRAKQANKGEGDHNAKCSGKIDHTADRDENHTKKGELAAAHKEAGEATKRKDGWRAASEKCGAFALAAAHQWDKRIK